MDKGARARVALLVAVGVLGLALAFLLLPKGPAPRRTAVEGDPLRLVRDKRPPKNAQSDPRPADQVSRALEMAGAWTVIADRLKRAGPSEAGVWAEQLGPLLVDLREHVQDPSDEAWGPLAERQRTLIEEIDAHPSWLEVERVAQRVERVRAVVVDQ